MSAKNTERPEENLKDIRRQLDVAKKEFDALEMKPRESPRDFEYRVKRHSDKLLSLKVAEKVQRQLLEQDVRDAEKQLKKRNPDLRREIPVQDQGLPGRPCVLSRRKRNPNCFPVLRHE